MNDHIGACIFSSLSPPTSLRRAVPVSCSIALVWGELVGLPPCLGCVTTHRSVDDVVAHCQSLRASVNVDGGRHGQRWIQGGKLDSKTPGKQAKNAKENKNKDMESSPNLLKPGD